MTIYFFKENKIIEANKDDYDYREYDHSPTGLAPKYFIENDFLCFWQSGKMMLTTCGGDDAIKKLEKIKNLEFEEWVENRCPYPFYFAKDYDEAMELHLQNDQE